MAFRSLVQTQRSMHCVNHLHCQIDLHLTYWSSNVRRRYPAVHATMNDLGRGTAD